MKTLKDFLNTIQNQLDEAVPEHLRHIPDSWDHHSMVSDVTHEKIRNALGPKGFKIVPLPKEETDIDPDVAEHLTKHNWQVTDYAKGMASKKTQVGAPERGIPLREKIVHKAIGGILNETGAPDHIKRAFENDPARARTTGENNLGILYSSTARANFDISGQDTSWTDQSCMNPTSGSNKRYLEQDSRYGSMPATLINMNDKGAHEDGVATKPLARILSKPMTEHRGDHTSDTIMRAEPNDWGDGSSRFVNAVNQFNTENFPAKADTTYHLHPDLYRDKMTDTYRAKSKKEIEDAVTNSKSIVDNVGDALDNELIGHAISHFNKNKDTLSDNAKAQFLTRIARVGNLNSQHVAALHKIGKESKDVDGVSNLIYGHGDKLSSSVLHDFLNKTDMDDLPPKVLMHNKLPSDVIDKLKPRDYKFVRKSLLKPKHYQKVVDAYLKDSSGSSAYNLLYNAGHYTTDQLDEITKVPSVRQTASVVLNEPNFNKSHHDNLIEDAKGKSYKNRMQHLLQNSKFASVKDIKTHDDGKLEDLLKNKNLSVDEHKKIAHALANDKDLIESGDNVTIPEHISKHLTDEDHDKLSKTQGNLTFESSKHSNKHIKSIHKTIKEVDDLISEHKNNEEAKDSDYNPEDDATHNELKDVLHKHIMKYARTIDDHVDKHGDNQDEVDKAESHLNKLNNLDNYDLSKGTDDRYHHDYYAKDVHNKIKRQTNRNNNVD